MSMVLGFWSEVNELQHSATHATELFVERLSIHPIGREHFLFIYLCVRGINFSSFYNFAIEFWNCSDSCSFLFFRCFKHTIFSELSVTTLDTISNKVITLDIINNKWNNRNETLQNPFDEVHYKRKILICFYFLSDGARGKFMKYPLLMKSIQKYVSFCLVKNLF